LKDVGLRKRIRLKLTLKTGVKYVHRIHLGKDVVPLRGRMNTTENFHVIKWVGGCIDDYLFIVHSVNYTEEQI
jgi:hypothetical protein